ncbi:PQQ-binding-like beta-propeller repeat protein [Rhodococcoides navarretei]|uniref:Pyrroloquinoline-quinone binding quinoprotein n=1 Tax=Rhodococcus navarretei TaxID=3128981 RepID=A0ABU9CTE2_9NOCA
MTDPQRRSTIRAGVAVAVAVVSVIAAVVVVSMHDVPVEQPADIQAMTPTFSPETITTQVPSGPVLDPSWQLDAEAVYGREFAAFRSPAADLMFDSGATGAIDAGDVLVTAVGLPNPRSYSVDAIEFVAVDAGDGDVRWKKSPGSVDQCASEAVGDEIVCLDSYSDSPSIVRIGVDDGEARRTTIPEAWFPYAIESDGGSVFLLEGNPEDGESVLRGGSVDALDQMWSRPITSSAGWEDVAGPLIHVDDGRGVVTLGGEATFFDPRTGTPVDGLELTTGATVVDLSGTEVWALQDPYSSETIVGNTVYSFEENALMATTNSNDVRWRWPLPEGVDGFTESGSIVEAQSGVFFLGTESMVRLESVPT